MKAFNIRHKKEVSIITLAAYLFFFGAAVVHTHSIKIQTAQTISLPGSFGTNAAKDPYLDSQNNCSLSGFLHTYFSVTSIYPSDIIFCPAGDRQTAIQTDDFYLSLRLSSNLLRAPPSDC